MQNNVNSNISWFSKCYVQNIWQVVRWWHHQLTHLHIHIDWSRNVLWKFAKLQSVITSLFFNRFSSGFHCYVWKFLLFFLKFKLNLFRISPLMQNVFEFYTDLWRRPRKTGVAWYPGCRIPTELHLRGTAKQTGHCGNSQLHHLHQ